MPGHGGHRGGGHMHRGGHHMGGHRAMGHAVRTVHVVHHGHRAVHGHRVVHGHRAMGHGHVVVRRGHGVYHGYNPRARRVIALNVRFGQGGYGARYGYQRGWGAAERLFYNLDSRSGR